MGMRRQTSLAHLVPIILGEYMARMPSLYTSTGHQNARIMTVLEDSSGQLGYVLVRCEIAGVDPGFSS